MDYYFEVKILPDAELRENVLLNKVYSKLHKALIEIRSTSIGVSFPKYNVMLGSVVRVHSQKIELEKLRAVNWLGGLGGYCEVTEITKVPNETKHRIISRKQSNMKQSKLKRLLKRGTIDSGKLKSYKAKMFEKSLDNPYLELESATNGHKYRRYISIGKLQISPSSGYFDHFGLSKEATIPWF